jgi:pseudaminic acid cytidylyltransferase
MSSLAIIPARGGSKRIPRKNIRCFHGKPMIAWSIHAALESNAFDAVLVTTDNEEIASIAEKAGAIVPFQRPSELSCDFAPTMPVLVHAIDWWQKNRYMLEFAGCIYATAPFIRPKILSQAIQILHTSASDFVLSVARFDYPVQRSLRLDGNGMLNFAEPENALKRSQDLEPRYHDAGQFFAGRVEAFQHYEAVLNGRCQPMIIPNDEAVDIDTEEDWRMAEKLYAIHDR